MSGGSYDYLFLADESALSSRLDDIDRMANRLFETRHINAAVDTARVAELLREAAALKEQLSAVWRAMEWVDSKDWGPEQLAATVREYTK